MNEPPRTDDLSVRSRRGVATPSEERRLRMLLGASTVERFLDSFGRDCDEFAATEPGDEALLARLVARTAAEPPRARWGRWSVAPVAAGALLLGTAVAAALSVPAWWSAPAPAMARCDTCRTDGARAPAPRAAAPVALTAATADGFAPANAAPAAGVPSAAETRAAADHASPPARAAQTAAEAFAEANALRRSGQHAAAVSAYGQLQRSHPGSAEALLSHVVLGRILLQQGSAMAAHEQFGRYLRAAPTGSLAEEALFGQATALRAAGRTAEERRLLEQLVARFPGSVTARAARSRLEELD